MIWVRWLLRHISSFVFLLLLLLQAGLMFGLEPTQLDHFAFFFILLWRSLLLLLHIVTATSWGIVRWVLAWRRLRAHWNERRFMRSACANCRLFISINLRGWLINIGSCGTLCSLTFWRSILGVVDWLWWRVIVLGWRWWLLLCIESVLTSNLGRDRFDCWCLVFKTHFLS